MIRFRIVPSAVLCTLLALQLSPVYAQEDTMHGAAEEVITLKVGDIFEILPVHNLPQDSSFTWILTQDRTFLEASRAPVFRKRFIQPGMYTLFGEIVSPDGSRKISRTFTINYQARQPGETVGEPVGSGSGILVSTVPATDALGRAALKAGSRLIHLMPVDPENAPFALDTDLGQDTDRDGDSSNDLDATDTFFTEDGTPLYLWLTDEPLERHEISITAARPEGAQVQKIVVLESGFAQSEGVVQGPVRITATQNGSRIFEFSATFEDGAPAGAQLLYQWQFGDGKQSLITSPKHEYAEDGDYTVRLLIRNLRDGSELADVSTSVNVRNVDAGPSSEPSQPSSEAPSDNTDAESNSGFSLRSILILGGVFLGSIAFGAVVMVLLSLLRKNKGSMADKIEKLEQAVIKPSDSAPAPLTITPPAAPASPTPTTPPTTPTTPPPEIAQREVERSTSNPVAQPAQSVNPATAPAWLKQPTTSPPAAAQQQRPAPQQPRPVPTPSQPSPPPQTPKQPTPSWLQQPAPKPAPTSAPAPAPQQPKTPVQPPVSPAPKPAQAPTPKPVVPQNQPAPATPSAPKPQQPVVKQGTPAWLQQTPQPPSAPATPPAPVTPKAPVVPQQQPQPPAAQPKPPTPAPATPAQPAPQNPAPKPVEPVVPVNVPSTPVVPAQNPPAAPVQPEQTPPADQPIAIIRAESLNPENQQNG